MNVLDPLKRSRTPLVALLVATASLWLLAQRIYGSPSQTAGQTEPTAPDEYSELPAVEAPLVPYIVDENGNIIPNPHFVLPGNPLQPEEPAPERPHDPADDEPVQGEEGHSVQGGPLAPRRAPLRPAPAPVPPLKDASPGNPSKIRRNQQAPGVVIGF